MVSPLLIALQPTAQRPFKTLPSHISLYINSHSPVMHLICQTFSGKPYSYSYSPLRFEAVQNVLSWTTDRIRRLSWRQHSETKQTHSSIFLDGSTFICPARLMHPMESRSSFQTSLIGLLYPRQRDYKALAFAS